MAALTEPTHVLRVIRVETGGDKVAARLRIVVCDRGGPVMADHAHRITIKHDPPGGAMPAAVPACRR
jgi:hypothetical protein